MECNEIYTKVFNTLCANVEPLLFSNKFVRTMVDICSNYNTLLGNSGIENAKYRTEKPKHRLRHRFNDIIQFYRPDGFGMSDVVYGPNTSISEVINFVHLIDDNSSVPLSQSSVEDLDSATFSSPLPSGPQHVSTSTCQRELFHTAISYSREHFRYSQQFALATTSDGFA